MNRAERRSQQRLERKGSTRASTTSGVRQRARRPPGLVASTAGGLESRAPIAGCQIRSLRAEDVPVVAQLTRTAGVELQDGYIEALERNTLAVALARAPREGPRGVLQEVVDTTTAAGGDLNEVIARLAVVLVAEDPDAGVVGTVFATPPGIVLTNNLELGVPSPQVFKAATQIIKAKAVAVVPAHRRRGIAAGLLDAMCDLYQRAGTQLLYGQIETTRNLHDYYQRLGWKILAPGEPHDLGRFGLVAPIVPVPGEQLMTRPLL
jgi:GNAT superfamily N-acetyltransferase